MALSPVLANVVAAGSEQGLLTFSAQTRLLVVAPHPDDETIATGVLIQQVRAAGGDVHILLLTAGDNNPWPQRWLERRLRIGGNDRQRWGRRRYAELQQALHDLDVPQTALHSLGWPDMGVTGYLLESTAAAVAELTAQIVQCRPNLIALPALDDRHPDHGSAHVLLRMALAGQSDPPRLLGYSLHGHANAGASIDLHATDAQLKNKLAALAAHRSQLALSGRRMHRLAMRPERYVEVASMSPRDRLLLPWQPPVCLWPWLRLSVAGSGGVRQWRWRDAPLIRRHGVFQLLSEGVGTAAPLFARLTLAVPSPWIFDHWGWCELRENPGGEAAGLARVE